MKHLFLLMGLLLTLSGTALLVATILTDFNSGDIALSMIAFIIGIPSLVLSIMAIQKND